MAFNLTAFNRTAFNRSEAEKTVKISRASMKETVSVALGISLQIGVTVFINERVSANVEGEPTRKLRQAAAYESVSSAGEALVSVVIKLSLLEQVVNESEISADLYLGAEPAENITTESYISGNIIPYTDYAETVEEETELSAKINLDTEIFELVNQTASVFAVDTKVCQIGSASNRFVLKPGSRLIIDAANYNVLLDGENAIWYQSGDWIDELNRTTTNIAISASSGSAGLTATILYTERYL